MRGVILNFTGDRANWGCQATSKGLFRFLSHTLGPLGVNQISTVLFPHTHVKDVWHRNRYGARLRGIYSNEAPTDADLRFLERLCQDRFGAHFEKVKNADLVFFQGEGTMGPTTFYENCRVFGLPYLAKMLWNKPVITLNQSFVVNSPADLKAAANIFNAFNLNAFREAKSLEEAKKCGIKTPILCPDFAFVDAADASLVPPTPAAPPYFCVTGSAGMQNYDFEGYVRSIVALTEETDLVPTCIYSRNSDRKLLNSLQDKLGADYVKSVSQSEYKTHASILPVLSQAAFTLGGRYHTAISSLCMRTPVILTAGNSHKNKGLGSLVGMDLPVFEPQNGAEIVAQAVAYLNDKDYVDATLNIGLMKVLKTQAAFSRYLAECMPALLANETIAQGMSETISGDSALVLPLIKPFSKAAPKRARLRSQIDINANLRQSDWAVQ